MSWAERDGSRLLPGDIVLHHGHFGLVLYVSVLASGASFYVALERGQVYIEAFAPRQKVKVAETCCQTESERLVEAGTIEIISA